MMIAYIPRGIDLSLADFIQLTLDFPWTWLTELACVITVLLSRLRDRSDTGLRLPRSHDSSHVWVLPFYVWGLQSLFHFLDRASALKFVSVELVFDAIFEIALALFTLVVLQSVAVLSLGEAPAVLLGLKGGRHGAAVAVLLSLLLILTFYLIVLDFQTRLYGLPLPLT